MRGHRALVGFIFLLLIVNLSSSVSIAQSVKEYDGPGIDIIVPNEHNVFLHGTEENPELMSICV